MKQYYDPFFVSANIALNRKDKETKHYLVAWNLGNFFGSTSHEQVGDSAVFPKFPRKITPQGENVLRIRRSLRMRANLQ